MRRHLPVLLLSALAAMPLAARAQTDDATAKLAQTKGCLACHTVDKKLVGPAYRDVAAKYAGKKDAVDMLAAKVQKGGAGNWGQVPMPPQQVTDAEAHQLVQWVLKQK